MILGIKVILTDMLLRLDYGGKGFGAELLATQVVTFPIIIALWHVMWVCWVIGLGSCVSAHIVGLVDTVRCC